MGDGGEAEPPGGQCVVEPGCLLYGIQEVNMKREKSHGPDIFFKGMAPSHLTPFCWALPLLRIPQAGHQAFITRAFGGIIQTHIIDGCIIKVIQTHSRRERLKQEGTAARSQVGTESMWGF